MASDVLLRGGEQITESDLRRILARTAITGYIVEGGLGVDYYDADDTIDVGAGRVYIDAGGEDIPIATDAFVGHDLVSNAVNRVWVTFDASVEDDDAAVALASNTTGSAPSLPSIAIAEVDTNQSGDAAITLLNRGTTPTIEGADINPRSVGSSQPALSSAAETTRVTEPVVRAWNGTDSYTDYDISRGSGSDDIAAGIEQAFADGAIALELPAGILRFDTTITPPNHCYIAGQGSQQAHDRGTELRYQGTGTAVDTAAHDVTPALRDLHINGRGSGSVGLATSAATLLDNVRIQNCTDVGWQLGASSYYSTAIRSYFMENSHGIAGGSNAVQIIGCKIHSNDRHGIRLSNKSRSLVISGGCGIERNGGAAVYGLVSANILGPVVITGNYIERNGGGTTSDIRVSGNARRWRIVGNYFNVGDAAGFENPQAVYVDVSDGCVVAENYLEGDYTRGVNVTGDAVNTRIRDTDGLTNATLPVLDNGTRTIFEGWGVNPGDPRSTGQWNGHGREGLSVWSGVFNNGYVYRDGAWQPIAGREVVYRATNYLSSGETIIYGLDATLNDVLLATATPANDPGNNTGFQAETFFNTSLNAMRLRVTETENAGGGDARIRVFKLN